MSLIQILRSLGDESFIAGLKRVNEMSSDKRWGKTPSGDLSAVAHEREGGSREAYRKTHERAK